MLPELDYIKVLRRTQFPFFILNSNDVYYRDGLVTINEKVVDDRNQKGATLGARRLLTPHKKYLLKKCVLGFTELMDCKATHFIDNRGFYFTYVKTKLVSVVSYKITRKRFYDTYSTVFCKGINNFFVLPSLPRSSEWAQIIQLDGLPWRLYSTSEGYIEKYRRKI